MPDKCGTLHIVWQAGAELRRNRLHQLTTAVRAAVLEGRWTQFIPPALTDTLKKEWSRCDGALNRLDEYRTDNPGRAQADERVVACKAALEAAQAAANESMALYEARYEELKGLPQLFIAV